MIRIIAPPAQTPVSLETVKAHLRIDGDDEDDLLTLYLKAATRRAEDITGRALITQTVEQICVHVCREAELTRWPVQSVVSVRLGSVDVGSYTARLGDNATIHGLPNGDIAVQYKAGYGDTGDSVPEPIQQWILATVGTFYENRETEIADSRAATVNISYLDCLLDGYRIWSA